MADIKSTSFRINEDDIAKFKEFADKEGYNQAEAFKSIMQTVEMARAKNMIKDRAKEIEVFQDTINNLMSMFLNSLNVNQTSEERIREELSKELQAKENTISALYEQVQDLKAENKTLRDNSKELDHKVTMLTERGMELIEQYNTLENQLKVSNKNNETLQEQLTEYKQYREQYKSLEKDLEKLKADHEALKENNNRLSNDNELLSNKINANGDMITFYKDEIESKNKSIKEYKDNIKALENKYDKQIEDIKAEHEKATHEQLENTVSNLNSRHEVELSKKDLEIQKLNNLIEQLENKTKKKDVKEGE